MLCNCDHQLSSFCKIETLYLLNSILPEAPVNHYSTSFLLDQPK